MTRRMHMEELTAIAVPSQPALSPDGSRVVYVLRTLDGEGDRNVDQLWTVPVAGGTPRRLTSGHTDTSPVWSPDGSRLAFTASVDPTDGSGPLVAQRLDYQADGAGMFGNVRSQLHVLDVA